MKELVEAIARSLVENPSAITVTEEAGPDGVVLIRLASAPADLGRIIGKEGRTAKAMRTLLNAKATRENKRVLLQIME